MSSTSWRVRSGGALLLLAGLVSLGCGGSNNPAALNADLTGTWEGIFQVNLGSGGTVNLDIEMVLTQEGDSVTGVYTIDEESHFGTIRGLVDGFSAEGTLFQQAGCEGSFSGTAEISSDGTSMEGEFDGSDCHNTHSGGILSATKNP